MTDARKYYYLKLKDNFFDSDAMIVLENMTDGYLYSNILLKLYLRSLKYQGKLMYNERIPYNSDVLAKVTRHNVGVIEKALKVLKDLGLIEIMDNGAIYMLDIQNFVGQSSTEADRVRRYRAVIDKEKLGGVQMYDKRTPELDIERDIDTELEAKGADKETVSSPPKEKPNKLSYGEYGWVKLTEEQYGKLIDDLGREETNACIKHIDESAQSTGNKNKWKDWNLVIRRCKREGWHKRYSPDKKETSYSSLKKGNQ